MLLHNYQASWVNTFIYSCQNGLMGGIFFLDQSKLLKCRPNPQNGVCLGMCYVCRAMQPPNVLEIMQSSIVVYGAESQLLRCIHQKKY